MIRFPNILLNMNHLKECQCYCPILFSLVQIKFYKKYLTDKTYTGNFLTYCISFVLNNCRNSQIDPRPSSITALQDIVMVIQQLSTTMHVICDLNMKQVKRIENTVSSRTCSEEPRHT